MGGLGVKVQHFPLTLLVVLTTLTLPCERDSIVSTFVFVALYTMLHKKNWTLLFLLHVFTLTKTSCEVYMYNCTTGILTVCDSLTILCQCHYNKLT